jgi:hypothetical protein
LLKVDSASAFEELGMFIPFGDHPVDEGRAVLRRTAVPQLMGE